MAIKPRNRKHSDLLALLLAFDYGKCKQAPENG